jgi:hypothetical protein
MLNIIDITIDFEFGHIDNRTMIVDILINNKLTLENSSDAKIILKQVSIPNEIKIKFSGKTPGKDTKVDNLGNIIQDMYVKIVGIKIDNLKIPNWVIEKKLSYTTDQGKELQTAYIGFNGTMTIPIPENNVFAFYRRLNYDS